MVGVAMTTSEINSGNVRPTEAETWSLIDEIAECGHGTICAGSGWIVMVGRYPRRWDAYPDEVPPGIVHISNQVAGQPKMTAAELAIHIREGLEIARSEATKGKNAQARKVTTPAPPRKIPPPELYDRTPDYLQEQTKQGDLTTNIEETTNAVPGQA